MRAQLNTYGRVRITNVNIVFEPKCRLRAAQPNVSMLARIRAVFYVLSACPVLCWKTNALPKLIQNCRSMAIYSIASNRVVVVVVNVRE